MTQTIPISPRLTKSVFARNSMDFTALIKELIDNPVAEMANTPDGFVTKVEVIINANWGDGARIIDLDSARIVIKDNSVGIKRNLLSSCLSVGKEESQPKSIHSLHEHGFGMKIAIWSLGDLEYIITKDKGEKTSTKIIDLPTEGKLSIFDNDLFCENESGTVISINKLNKEKVFSIVRKCDISMWVVPYLSAVYSNLLVTNQMNKKRLELSIILQDLKENEITRWNLEPTEMYWRNNKIDERQSINNKKLDYSADFNLGIAASDAEYTQYGKELRGKNNPFHPWNKKISIYINDRIICRKSLEDLINPHVGEDLKISGNYIVPYQGSIILRKGFKTTLFKDDIEPDENYIDLIKRIAIKAKAFISSEANRTQKLLNQEKDIREKLCKNWIGAGCYCDPHRKIPICNGEADIIKYNKPHEEIDFKKDLGTLCELKAEEADALSCYQILMYLETCSGIYKDKAWLIAPSFSQGCKNIVQKFEKEKGIKILMKSFSDVGLDNFDSTKKTRNRNKKLKTVNI